MITVFLVVVFFGCFFNTFAIKFEDSLNSCRQHGDISSANGSLH